MSYFSQLASFKDKIGKAKSFYVVVIDLEGERYESSSIPIEILDSVVLELEQVFVDVSSYAVWDHVVGKLTTFAPGTIRRYEIVIG